MIKVVIFDFGNVLCAFTNQLLINRISDYTNLSPEQVTNILYKQSGLPVQYETGLITSQEFFEKLSKLFNLSLSFQELHDVYSKDKFTLIDGMSDVIQKIKSSYKVALLSNCSEWDYSYAIKLLPVIESFDVVTKSFEVKAMKLSKKIFEVTIQQLGVQPNECIYTDDIYEYVEVANSLGIDGIHFTGKDSFVRELEKRNILTS